MADGMHRHCKGLHHNYQRVCAACTRKHTVSTWHGDAPRSRAKCRRRTPGNAALAAHTRRVYSVCCTTTRQRVRAQERVRINAQPARACGPCACDCGITALSNQERVHDVGCGTRSGRGTRATYGAACARVPARALSRDGSTRCHRRTRTRGQAADTQCQAHARFQVARSPNATMHGKFGAAAARAFARV